MGTSCTCTICTKYIGTNCESRRLTLEDALSLEIWLPRYHGVHEELDLGEEDALRLHLDDHAVPIVLDELLEAQELDGAQLAPVLPVDADLQLAVLHQAHSSNT